NSYISDRITMTVSDNGVGIDPKDLPRLFFAFERGDAALSTNASGLGLGLALTRSIIEAHDGKLEATRGGRGKGCTFAIELRTERPSAVVRAQSRSDRQTSRSLRILLAEDNAATVRIVADLLRQKGHEVTIATCLSRALEAASGEFDLVV